MLDNNKGEPELPVARAFEEAVCLELVPFSIL
jgi:hypothetical protein